VGRRRVLLAVPVLAAVLAAIVGGYMLGATQNQQAPQPDNAMHIELYVYKNGRLAYYDPDDPVTTNFLHLLEAILDNDNDEYDTVTFMDGSKLDLEDAANTQLYEVGGAGVVLSNAAVTFDRSMTQMPGEIAVIQVHADVVGSALQFTGTWTSNMTTNITSIGLVWMLDDHKSVNDPSNTALILVDTLQQPLTVNNGDVVTVVYKIVFP